MKLYNYTRKTLFIIAIFVLVAINYFFSNLALKADFSAHKAYSLSLSSKKILKGLKEKTTVTLYISSKLPPSVIPVKRDVFDLLDEYKNSSNGKLKVVTKDPGASEKIEGEALNAGVSRIQFSELENDQFSVKNGYFGASISYNGKQEAIKTLLNPSTLENEISAALHRVSRAKSPSIGVLSLSETDALTGLQEFLNTSFAVIPMNFDGLSDTTAVDAMLYKDDRVTALTPEQIQKLKSFVEKGRTLFILADGMWVDNTLLPQKAENKANDLLKQYGISINQDLVWSTYAETVMFRTNAFNVNARYPYWVRLGAVAMRNLAFARGDSAVVLPWASSITAKGPGIKELLVLETGAHRVTKDFYLVPTQLTLQVLPKQSRTVFAVEKKVQNNGRLVVIGNSHFVEDGFAGTTGLNYDFFAKLLDTYASGGVLSGIPQRGIDYQPIAQTDETTRNGVRYAVIIIPSLLFIGYGLLRAQLRKNS